MEVRFFHGVVWVFGVHFSRGRGGIHCWVVRNILGSEKSFPKMEGRKMFWRGGHLKWALAAHQNKCAHLHRLPGNHQTLKSVVTQHPSWKSYWLSLFASIMKKTKNNFRTGSSKALMWDHINTDLLRSWGRIPTSFFRGKKNRPPFLLFPEFSLSGKRGNFSACFPALVHDLEIGGKISEFWTFQNIIDFFLAMRQRRN